MYITKDEFIQAYENMIEYEKDRIAGLPYGSGLLAETAQLNALEKGLLLIKRSPCKKLHIQFKGD